MVEDAHYMERALSLAELGRGRASPNPMVGALVVSPAGVIVGAGHHEEAGLAHAEIQALTEAGSGATGATLYCTLEPCCHTGRTGPCVERIVEAGIARVVVGVEDPNPLVNGGGIRYLRRHGVHVDVGVCRAEAARLNQAFFTLIGKHRPFVTLKVATSLDGRIAATSGRRTQLTSAPANRQVHLLRAEVDAIAVGSGTVLADDPLLTARGVHRSRPLTRVLFDTRLRTPPAARVLSTLDAGPVIIVTTEAGLSAAPERAEGLRSAGATLEVLEARDLKAALVRLGSRGISSLLLEGGATLHRAAWDAGVVDRVQVYVAPVTLGAQGLPWLTGHRFSLAALHDVRIQSCGPDVLMEGYVYGAD